MVGRIILHWIQPWNVGALSSEQSSVLDFIQVHVQTLAAYLPPPQRQLNREPLMIE